MKRWLLAVGAFATFSGCVNFQSMALKKDQDSLDTTSKSVVLMGIEVSRTDDSRYQPLPTTAWVTDLYPGAKGQSQRFELNPTNNSTQIEGKTVYLASIALRPGRYQLEGLSGIAAAFPFVGNFFIPILADFEVKSATVSYIGHLGAVMRSRREGEFRAGAVVPLVQQSATGMMSHSWDVVIDDQSANDLAGFRELYPVLAGISVEKEPLPAWDRAAAQRRWDGKSGVEENSATSADAGQGPE